MVKTINVGLIMPSSEWMGGVIYIQNLVKAITSLPLDKRSHIKLYLFVNSNLTESYYENLRDFVEEIYIEDCLSLNTFNKVLWKIGRNISWLKDKRLVEIVKEKKIDFVYPVPNNSGISWNFHCSWSAWIPDFQHKYIPSLFSKKTIRNRNFIEKKIAEMAPNIVLSSKDAMKDFNHFYPDAKSRKFILNFRTIPEEEWFKNILDPENNQKKYNLPNKFFLVSNQFWVHKNHKIIIESLCILKAKNIYPVIVCTGKIYDSRFPQYTQEIHQLIEANQLNEQFIILGLIPRFDQIQLMRRALAVIQPSLFEGWSTVVEDARLLGKVIVLSDIPVHIEQNPPNTRFFKRDSPQELADQIELLLTRLNPGPDLIAESEAGVKNRLEYQIYAEQFLDIVQNSLS